MTTTDATGDGGGRSTFSVAKAIGWFVAIVVAGGLLLAAVPAIQAFGMVLRASLFG